MIKQGAGQLVLPADKNRTGQGRTRSGLPAGSPKSPHWTSSWFCSSLSRRTGRPTSYTPAATHAPTPVLSDLRAAHSTRRQVRPGGMRLQQRHMQHTAWSMPDALLHCLTRTGLPAWAAAWYPCLGCCPLSAPMRRRRCTHAMPRRRAVSRHRRQLHAGSSPHVHVPPPPPAAPPTHAAPTHQVESPSPTPMAKLVARPPTRQRAKAMGVR